MRGLPVERFAFFIVLLLPYTSVKSQIGCLQKDSEGKSEKSTLFTDFATFAQKLLCQIKFIVRSFQFIVDGPTSPSKEKKKSLTKKK